MNKTIIINAITRAHVIYEPSFNSSICIQIHRSNYNMNAMLMNIDPSLKRNFPKNV